jgi:predicted branched-subunit amino acid permease
MLDFVAVPAIVVITYFIGLIIKNFGKLDKWIPIICGGSGAIIALVAFFTIPGYIPAENWLVAIVLGIVSGLSSTGANQVYKQLKK